MREGWCLSQSVLCCLAVSRARARATATHYCSPSPHIWRWVLWSGGHDHARPINPITTVMNSLAGKITFKGFHIRSSILWKCFYLTLKCSEWCAGSHVNKRSDTVDDGLLLSTGFMNLATAWINKTFSLQHGKLFSMSFISLLSEVHTLNEISIWRHSSP